MLTKLIESLLSMLDKDVPDNCKTCPQFFHLLLAYAKMVMDWPSALDPTQSLRSSRYFTEVYI